jgi:hypothetical protein
MGTDEKELLGPECESCGNQFTVIWWCTKRKVIVKVCIKNIFYINMGRYRGSQEVG